MTTKDIHSQLSTWQWIVLILGLFSLLCLVVIGRPVQAKAADTVVLDTLTDSPIESFWATDECGWTAMAVSVPTATVVTKVEVKFGSANGSLVELAFLPYEPASSTSGQTPFAGVTPIGSMGTPTVDGALVGTYTGSVSLDAGTYFIGFRGSASPVTPGIAMSASIESVTKTGTWDFYGTSAGTFRAAYCPIFDTGTRTMLVRVTAGSTSEPGEPTAISGVPGNKKIRLSWNPPASNGGSPVTGYKVLYTTSGAHAPLSQWLEGERACAPRATGISTEAHCEFTGLNNGTRYWFKVAAINYVGQSSWSSSGPDVGVAPTGKR